MPPNRTVSAPISSVAPRVANSRESPALRPPDLVAALATAAQSRTASREAMAARVSAYVYGNILVMAALVTVMPSGLQTTAGVLAVLGVGLSTFVAHALSQGVALRVRVGRSLTAADVVAELRNALPVLSSTLLPVAVVGCSTLIGLSSLPTLVAALAVPAGRLALLGAVVDNLHDRRSSPRLVLAGAGLALVGVAAAVLKILLPH